MDYTFLLLVTGFTSCGLFIGFNKRNMSYQDVSTVIQTSRAVPYDYLPLVFPLAACWCFTVCFSRLLGLCLFSFFPLAEQICKFQSIEGEEAVGDQLMELVDQMKSMLSKVSHTGECLIQLADRFTVFSFVK